MKKKSAKWRHGRYPFTMTRQCQPFPSCHQSATVLALQVSFYIAFGLCLLTADFQDAC
jgi:hypothetical protein